MSQCEVCIDNEFIYIESTNTNYNPRHGLIKHTMQLIESMKSFDEYDSEYNNLILASYKEAGWTKRHSKNELMQIFNIVKSKIKLIDVSKSQNYICI